MNILDLEINNFPKGKCNRSSGRPAMQDCTSFIVFHVTKVHIVNFMPLHICRSTITTIRSGPYDTYKNFLKHYVAIISNFLTGRILHFVCQIHEPERPIYLLIFIFYLFSFKYIFIPFSFKNSNHYFEVSSSASGFTLTLN